MERRPSSNSRSRGATRRRKRRVAKRFLVFVISLLMIAAAIVLLVNANARRAARANEGNQAAENTPRVTTGPDGQLIEIDATEPTPTPEPTPEPTPAPLPVAATSETEPGVLGVRTEMNLDGDDIDSFSRSAPVEFGDAGEYTPLEGVTTFRGNNYRDLTSYGTADITEGELEQAWEVETRAIPKGEGGSGYWTGAGWTGQPLIVRWPEATRRIMNLNDDKKDKDGLVEVIYAIEDGRVYFLDIEDGKRTRDTLNMGQTFKGSGGLDPRGYPILYVGGGDSTPEKDGFDAKSQRFFMVNLINGETMYEFGMSRDPYAQRGWHAYDGAAVVDAETDTFIAAGENGIVYSMNLNTEYDEAAGTLSIDPKEVLKLRYSTSRSREHGEDAYWVGMESSPAIYRNYMYIADNGGNFFCFDMNTMEVVWAADCLDDTNGSPVLELENGHPYLYLSTSLHWTQDRDAQGTIPLWKFDGLTGEVVWSKEYECNTVSGVSGGVQSTALVGKGPLSDFVFFSVSRTPRTSTGILVALNKQSGEVEWELPLDTYAWSSPIAIYSEDDKGYVVQCEQGGRMHLIDGLSGEKLDTIRFTQTNSDGEESGQTIEATPAAFGNMIVVGTRGQRIYGVRVK